MSDLKGRHFSAADGLMRIPAEGGRRGVPARGRDYAILLSALFDLYRLDLDPAHLVWAEELAREAFARLRDGNGLLRETPANDRVQPLPVHNTAMIFGLSTWGKSYESLERLFQLTGNAEFGDAADAILQRLTPALATQALVHTDFCQGGLVTARNCVVYLEGRPGEAVFDDLHGVLKQSPWGGVTILHLAPGLPESIKPPQAANRTRAVVMVGGEPVGEASNGSDLAALLRQSASSR
jgi:uncharacterized protein YyaL (SSP411 family)